MNARIVTIVVVIGVLLAAGFGATRYFAPEEREVTTDSEKAYEAYREGVDQMGRFRFDRAQVAFERAIELDPDFAMAQDRLAVTYRNLNQWDEADSMLTLAYEHRDGVSELESMSIARHYALVNEDRERGMELEDQMIEKYPDHPWVLRIRAERARRNQDYREAIALYDQILESDPESVEIHNLKGYMYIALGEYDDAVHALQRYAYYAPDNANPHDSLGEAYLYQGEYEEAIREFVKALEIEPAFIWSGVHLAQALAVTGQFDRAEETLLELEPIFEQRDQLSWMRMEQLRIDYMAERWEKLVQAAEAQLPLDDETLKHTEYAILLHYMRTAGYLELGEMDNAYAARAELEKLVQEVGEKQAEYGIWDSVIALNEAFLESRFGRAEGDPERAVDDLKKAIAKSRRSPHELTMYRQELVEDLLAAGRPEEAAEAANAALEKIPTSPTMNLLAAKCYFAMGDKEQALRHLRTHLEVMRFADEDHPRVAEAKQLLRQMVPRS